MSKNTHKKQSGIGGHIPPALAGAMGIKSNGSFNRFDGGEFIATSSEEARIAAAMGYKVASEERSAAVRWNGGKPIEPGHPAYAQMMANKTANILTGTSTTGGYHPYASACGGSDYLSSLGLGGHRAPVVSRLAPNPVGPVGPVGPLGPFVTNAVATAVTPAPTSVPVKPVAISAKPTPTVAQTEEQFQADVAKAIAKSLAVAPKPAADDDAMLSMMKRISVNEAASCGHSNYCEECGYKFHTRTAKFCSDCGTKRH